MSFLKFLFIPGNQQSSFPWKHKKQDDAEASDFIIRLDGDRSFVGVQSHAALPSRVHSDFLARLMEAE